MSRVLIVSSTGVGLVEVAVIAAAAATTTRIV